MNIEIKSIIAFIFAIQISITGFNQTPVPDCSQLQENYSGICGGNVPPFNAVSGSSSAGTTNPGNDYGCLFSTPNPAWYYLQIGNSGDLHLELHANNDIDFILYGPFSDFNAAATGCGNYGNGGSGSSITDCSYSGSSTEQIDIQGAQSGEVYVVLITNYANVPQLVTLTELPSTTATTDCSQVSSPCLSDPGTFVHLKDGLPTALDIYLCDGENFSIVSKQDYTLPNDSLVYPVGDGI